MDLVGQVVEHVWVYRRTGWSGRPVTLCCDEWGRRTMAVRLPRSRVLVVAYAACRHPACVVRRA